MFAFNGIRGSFRFHKSWAVYLLRVTLFLSTPSYFSTLWYILVLSSYLSVGPTSVLFSWLFPTTVPYEFCCSSYVLHDPPIGFSSIWLHQYYWGRSANNADSMQNIIECAAQIMPVYCDFFYSGVACCLLHFRPALLEDVKLNCSCLNVTSGCKSRGLICSCFCLCLHPSWLFLRK